jgi:hypothetical protein
MLHKLVLMRNSNHILRPFVTLHLLHTKENNIIYIKRDYIKWKSISPVYSTLGSIHTVNVNINKIIYFVYT